MSYADAPSLERLLRVLTYFTNSSQRFVFISFLNFILLFYAAAEKDLVSVQKSNTELFFFCLLCITSFFLEFLFFINYKSFHLLALKLQVVEFCPTALLVSTIFYPVCSHVCL